MKKREFSGTQKRGSSSVPSIRPYKGLESISAARGQEAGYILLDRWPVHHRAQWAICSCCYAPRCKAENLCFLLLFFSVFLHACSYLFILLCLQKGKKAASSSKRTGAKCSNLLLLLSLIFFATIWFLCSHMKKKIMQWCIKQCVAPHFHYECTEEIIQAAVPPVDKANEPLYCHGRGLV